MSLLQPKFSNILKKILKFYKCNYNLIYTVCTHNGRSSSVYYLLFISSIEPIGFFQRVGVRRNWVRVSGEKGTKAPSGVASVVAGVPQQASQRTDPCHTH